MTSKACCVPGCTTVIGQGVSLHKFPNPENEIERFRTWVMHVGGDIVGLTDTYIFKNRRVCNRHFEAIYQYPNNRLSRIALPLLHIPGGCAAPPLCPPKAMDIDIEPRIPAMLSTTRDAVENYGDKVDPTLQAVSAGPSTLRCNVSKKKALRMVASKMTKEEIELNKIILKTKAQLKRSEKTKADYKNRFKLAQQLCASKAYDIATKHMSTAAKTFFAMQVRQCKKRPRGRRFTLDEKILALSLYKPSPKAYRLLSQICILPKRRTLDKLMSKAILSPGVNQIIFEHLKKRVSKMPSHHRYCALVFDEMAIAAGLTYDKKNDEVNGLCDDGLTRKPEFCDHSLVFMIRGVFKKFKQPVAYSFCSGSTKTDSLVNQIKTVIAKIQETGLKIIATVCDQGATNVAAINSLINDTKAKYLRKEKEFKGGFFEVGDAVIHPIYDPPHLIKGIRNNLLTKHLEYTMNGKKRLAKWTHITALYKRGPNYRGVRLVPKLTARHVMPNLIPKMRVKHCTQVFSKSVAAALFFMTDAGKLPPEAIDTADLLFFFDELFDSVNGSFSKPQKGKIWRSAVTPKSPHHKLWQKSLVILKSMKFVDKRGRTGTVPSINSWIKTIQAFQEISKKLNVVGIRSLLLRNFNQDPIENFFGAIRAHGNRNIMPNANSFEASYKILLMNNIVSPKSVGSNCEEDGAYCLQSLKYFLTENSVQPFGAEQITDTELNISEEHLMMPTTILIDTENIIKSSDPTDIEKTAAVAYCSGWLLKAARKIIKNCENCTRSMESQTQEPFHKFITLKKFSDTSFLNYPTREFFDFFLYMENIVSEILKTNLASKNLCAYIEIVSLTNLNINFLNCELHKDKLCKFLFKKSIQFFILNYCKEVNNIITGKSPFFDQNDPIKQLASNYYNKYKKRIHQKNLPD